MRRWSLAGALLSVSCCSLVLLPSLSPLTSVSARRPVLRQLFLPQLVVIDGREMDTEATMETLVKVREFDPQRVSILVSLLLPTKSTSKLPLEQYFEAGADLFSQVRPPSLAPPSSLSRPPFLPHSVRRSSGPEAVSERGCEQRTRWIPSPVPSSALWPGGWSHEDLGRSLALT